MISGQQRQIHGIVCPLGMTPPVQIINFTEDPSERCCAFKRSMRRSKSSSSRQAKMKSTITLLFLLE